MNIEYMTGEPPEIWPESHEPYEPRGGCREAILAKEDEVLISSGAGTGKAQPLDSTVWTPNGPKTMEDIQVNDLVIGADGKPVKVIATHPNQAHLVYRVTFSDGSSTECADDHLWEVSWRDRNSPKLVRTEVLPTNQLLKDCIVFHGNAPRSKYKIRTTSAVCFNKQKVPIDPYVLGVLLGDGHLKRGEVSFTNIDEDLISLVSHRLGNEYKINRPRRMYCKISPNGWKPIKSSTAKKGYVGYHSGAKRYSCTKRKPNGRGTTYVGLFDTKEEAWAMVDSFKKEETHSVEELAGRGIWNDIRNLGLVESRSWNKFIPNIYKYNSKKVRLELLRGLMDTDGTVDRQNGQPSYCTTSKQLADDVVELIESLGGSCSISTKQPPVGKLAYIIWIRFNDPKKLFHLKRKKERCKKRTKYLVCRHIRTIERVGVKICKCITIANDNGLYLTDRFIVTHNSRAILEKILVCAEKYPGCRILICRKTRESMTQSTLVTWENKVLPKNHPCIGNVSRASRREYKFPNGSTVIIGGLKQSGKDQTQKIFSTDYDMAYVPEAIELSESEWDSITTRLRNGVMPYQQLIADTNPSSEHHWLNKRCSRGQCRMINSDHTDNPMLWDAKKNAYTAFGRKYIAKLDALTGVRKDRLRFGRWVSAEGMIYDMWSTKLHVVPAFDPPSNWRKIMVIDWGYTNSFCCQWYVIDGDGKMYLYREYVKVETIVEDHVRRIKEIMSPEERIEAIIGDHDAEDRATFERHFGRSVIPAPKAKNAGINSLSERLAFKKHDQPAPRFVVMDNALVDRDDKLEEAKKPIGLLEEIDGYVWNRTDPERPKEVPVDKDNHSMDCARYGSYYLDENEKYVQAAPLEQRQKVKDEHQQKFSPTQATPADWRGRPLGNWRGGLKGTDWRKQV